MWVEVSKLTEEYRRCYEESVCLSWLPPHVRKGIVHVNKPILSLDLFFAACLGRSLFSVVKICNCRSAIITLLFRFWRQSVTVEVPQFATCPVLSPISRINLDILYDALINRKCAHLHLAMRLIGTKLRSFTD